MAGQGLNPLGLGGSENLGPTTIEDLDIGGNDFVASGDFFPFYPFGPPNKQIHNFTDTSYATDNDLTRVDVLWDDLSLPAGATPAVLAQILVANIGTDETVAVRLRNITDSETVGSEQTGITSTGIQTVGPANYTPTTTASSIAFQWEWKEDTGSNSSRVVNPFVAIGIQL